MSAAAPDPSTATRTFVVEAAFSVAEVWAQWEELEKHGTPFQTRAWLLPWYGVIAPRFGATPVFVTVRDRGTRRPLMFFPLCRRRRHGLATIEFADLGVSDYNAPLLAPDIDLDAREMRRLWEDVVRILPPADVVRFEKVPETIRGRDNPIAHLDWMQRMKLSAWNFCHCPEREPLTTKAS